MVPKKKRECLACFRPETVQTEKDTPQAEGGLSVGQYCSDTFSFTSLNLDISRFLASVRNSECEPKGKMWSNQERFWLFIS